MIMSVAVPVVLYVEDEENDVFFMELAWKRLGLNLPLQVVRNGREAMDYLSGKDRFGDRQEYPLPSLVLLDLNLPMYSGFEVLEWIRGQPALRELRVVILTSSDQKRDIEQAAKLRADDFITKPTAPEELVRIVQRVCEGWLSPRTKVEREGED